MSQYGTIILNKPTGTIKQNLVYGNTSYNKIYGSSQISDVYIAPSSGYDSDALAYFARMNTQPSDRLKTALNTFIIGLKTDNIWDKIVCLIKMNLETQQQSTLNMKQDKYNLTLVNSPTFIPNVGFKIENSKYLKNGFNASTGVYNGEIGINDELWGIESFGKYAAGPSGYSINGAWGSLSTQSRMNIVQYDKYFTNYAAALQGDSGTLTYYITPTSTVDGYYLASRNQDKKTDFYIDSSYYSQATLTVNNIDDYELYIGALNQGSATYYTMDYKRGMIISKYLTDTQRNNFVSRVNTLNTTINSVNYDVDAAIFFSRMTGTPSDTLKSYINQLFLDYKACGYWNSCDVIVKCNIYDAQAGLLNLKIDSLNSTAVNSPTFVLGKGYIPDGGTSYINTTVNASTSTSIFTTNDAHIMSQLYYKTEATSKIDGVYDGLNYIGFPLSSNLPTYNRLNSTANGNLGYGATGHNFLGRYSSARMESYYGGVKTDVAIASASKPNKEIYFGGFNNNGSLSNAHFSGYSAYSIGKYLNDSIKNAVITANQIFDASLLSLMTFSGERINNGGFDDTSNWTIPGGGWVISGGVATFTATGSPLRMINSYSNPITQGNYYRLQFTITNATGASILFTDNACSTVFWHPLLVYYTVSNGSYDLYLKAYRNTTALNIYATGTAGLTFSIDNLSLKEYTL